jgi:ABC-2 type transport system permease protein
MRTGAPSRVAGLMLKDIAELRRHPGAVLPAVAMVVGSLVPAFVVAVGAPMLSGEQLGESPEFSHAARQALAAIPEMAALSGGALVQAFLFHQFSLLVLMVSVVASMSLAAHAVISEKAARTLEPLLATPLSTAELLAAKTLTPLGFALVLTWLTLGLYVAGIALVGEPGVASAFVGQRILLLFFLVGPLTALVSLLLAVIVSSRVNDARSAQQLGALVVLPITMAFVAQLAGQFVVGPGALLLVALGLAVLDAVLLWIGVRVFDRERILMKWK